MFLFSFVLSIILIAPYNEFRFNLNSDELYQNSIPINISQLISQMDILNEKKPAPKSVKPIPLVTPLEYLLPSEIKTNYANLYRCSAKILFLYSYYLYYNTKAHCWGEISSCYIQSRDESCLNKFIKCKFFIKKKGRDVTPAINLSKRCITKHQCNKKDLKELERAYELLSKTIYPDTKLR